MCQDCQPCQFPSSSVKAGVFRCPSTCCSCSIRERYDDSCIIILAGITRFSCFRCQHWASCCSVFTEYSTRTYSWPHSTSTIYVYYSYYQKTQRITTPCNIAQLFVRGHGRIVSHDDVIQLLHVKECLPHSFFLSKKVYSKSSIVKVLFIISFWPAQLKKNIPVSGQQASSLVGSCRRDGRRRAPFFYRCTQAVVRL